MRIRSLPDIRLDEGYVTSMLDSLKVAFRLFLNKDQPSSFDVLYRQAYTLVLHCRGEDLYNALKTSLQEHVRSNIVPELTQSEGDDLFKVLRRLHFEFDVACLLIRDVLMYMDRVYTSQRGVPRIKELAAQVFQQDVSLYANLGVKLRPLLIAPCLRGIDGENVDWKTWNDSCRTLLECSDDSRQLYEEQFEVPLLREVTERYRVKMRKLLADSNVSDFDVLTNTFVESEALYLENVDDKTTKEWLRSALDNVVTEAKKAHA